MSSLKSKAIILILILLLLTPSVTLASVPEPAPDPYPEEWLIEYYEWVAFQYANQQEYANSTGHGLGVMLDFIDWALYREAYGAYWWEPTGEYKVYYAHLFVEAYA